jgi:hypothetical protein
VDSYGPELSAQLSHALKASPEAVELSAAQLRNSPGVALISRELSEPKRMMRGTERNAGLVPGSVAQKLSDRQFLNFDDFRAAFWKSVADSHHAAEFPSPSHEPRIDNLARMRRGAAPVAPESQQMPGMTSYQLHHIQPIRVGGSVYDMSNLMIATPRFHAEVLDRTYHYGD